MNEPINSHLKEQGSEISFYSYVGMRLRERRNQLGWSLMTLGEKLDISHQQLQKYELGSVQLSAERLFKITSILEIPSDCLYKGYIEFSSFSPLPDTSDKLISVRNTPLSILIVEKDPLDELHIKETLQESDIPLQVNSLHCRGQQVLELLRNKQTLRKFPLPDIIFMELDIPQSDGMHLLRSIKRDPQLKEIPIIIVSNNLSKSRMRESYKNYASGYIYKSLDVDIFKKHLHTTVKYWSSMCLPHM